MRSYCLINLGAQENIELDLISIASTNEVRKLQGEQIGFYTFISDLSTKEIEDFLLTTDRHFILFGVDKNSYGAHLIDKSYENNLFEILLDGDNSDEDIVNIKRRLDFAEDMIKYMDDMESVVDPEPIIPKNITFDEIFDKLADEGYDNLTLYEKQRLEDFVK